jgi:hypothetical protein
MVYYDLLQFLAPQVKEIGRKRSIKKYLALSLVVEGSLPFFPLSNYFFDSLNALTIKGNKPRILGSDSGDDLLVDTIV